MALNSATYGNPVLTLQVSSLGQKGASSTSQSEHAMTGLEQAQVGLYKTRSIHMTQHKL